MTAVFDSQLDETDEPVDDGCPEFALRFEEVRWILDLVDDMDDALELYDAPVDGTVGLASVVFRKGSHFFRVRSIEGSWAIESGSTELVISDRD